MTPTDDYDEPDPPVWPAFWSSLLLPFVFATALVGVGIGVGLVLVLGRAR